MTTALLISVSSLFACGGGLDPGRQTSPMPPGAPDVAVDPDDDLSGLADLRCGRGEGCAPDTSGWLGETCCAFGDPVDTVAVGAFIEGVDIEVSDTHAAACSGFGPVVFALGSLPTLALEGVDGVGRCQRVAIGEVRPDGSSWLYFAHHGDGWIATPTLWAYRRDADGTMVELAELTEPDVLYEGLAIVGDHLLVAAHAGGIRSYALGADGIPQLVGVLDGFDNAVKLSVDGDLAYVIDEDRVWMVDVADPARPLLGDSAVTEGKPRDLEVDADRVYVALGADGLQVFTRSDGGLHPDRFLDTDGSIQGVSVDAETLALAAWDHLALYERDSLARIGSEKLKDRYEETLAVGHGAGYVFGIEWFSLSVLVTRPWLVAPDLSVGQEFLAFDASIPGERTLTLHNRGPLNALVGGLQVNDAALSVDAVEGRILPGEDLDVEVRFTPPAPGTDLEVHVSSNDPDDEHNPLVVAVSALGTEGLDVGDTLTEDFAFLDPTGAGELANLEGQITVLAYFALF